MFSRIIMPRLRVQLWFLLMINLVILVKFPGNSLPIPHHAEEDISKVLSLASLKTRPEVHSNTKRIGADAGGSEYPRIQKNTFQTPENLENADSRSHERTSQGSREFTSEGPRSLSRKYNTERSLFKRIVRLIKLRYNNVATAIGRVFNNPKHDLDEASGLDQDERNDHSFTVPGDDGWGSDDEDDDVDDGEHDSLQSPYDFLDDMKRKGAPDQTTIDEYDFEHSGGGRGSLRGSENGEQTIENPAPPNFKEKFMETRLIIFISVSANSFIIIRV